MSNSSDTRAQASEQWHEVADLTSLDPDFPTGVTVKEQPIGLFLHEGQVHALENVCPHAYALLTQGFQENGTIECSLHGASFEIATGKCLLEIGQRDLRCYPVKVENSRVSVQV